MTPSTCMHAKLLGPCFKTGRTSTTTPYSVTYVHNDHPPIVLHRFDWLRMLFTVTTVRSRVQSTPHSIYPTEMKQSNVSGTNQSKYGLQTQPITPCGE